MPTIHIYLYEGRTVDQKRELAKAITDDVVRIAKTTPDAVTVMYHDINKSDTASAGKLASDA
jgi:4-oxalocrotonate tautomerase